MVEVFDVVVAVDYRAGGAGSTVEEQTQRPVSIIDDISFDSHHINILSAEIAEDKSLEVQVSSQIAVSSRIAAGTASNHT